MDLEVQREREMEEQRQLAKWQRALAALQAADPSEHGEVMTATAAVVLLNPDYYHAWNMRKRSIMANMAALDLKEELGFNVDCIKVNPKSYYAWYHRRWVLTRAFSSDRPMDPSHELHLCQLLLDLDKRNCTPTIALIRYAHHC